MEYIKITLNGLELEVPADSTILQAANQAGVVIPTLCYLKDINEVAACRMCIVEVAGTEEPVTACNTKVFEGMEVSTDTPALFEQRKTTLELLCANHRFSCETCSRYSNCELHALMRIYGVDEYHLRYGQSRFEEEIDSSAAHLVRDNSKCVLCQRCVSVCEKQHGTACINVFNRGGKTSVRTLTTLDNENCVHCGACIQACPTGALTEADATRDVWMSTAAKGQYTAAIVSPFASCFGETLNFPAGEYGIGKLVSALRKMGFDAVYDGNAGAAIAATELVEKLKTSEATVLSGVCPAATRYFGQRDLIVSSSPLEAMVENVRSDCAKRFNVEKQKVTVVSIEPCVASKGSSAADIVVTIREMAAMYRRACVSRYTARKVWEQLQDESFDEISGLNEIQGYCKNGGILESAVLALGGTTKLLDDGTIELSYNINGAERKAIVITGLAYTDSLFDDNGIISKYNAIEVLACSGGCLAGGGMPRLHADKFSSGYAITSRFPGLRL